MENREQAAKSCDESIVCTVFPCKRERPVRQSCFHHIIFLLVPCSTIFGILVHLEAHENIMTLAPSFLPKTGWAIAHPPLTPLTLVAGQIQNEHHSSLFY